MCLYIERIFERANQFIHDFNIKLDDQSYEAEPDIRTEYSVSQQHQLIDLFDTMSQK